MSLTLCEHAGMPDAHCRCPKCIAYFTNMGAVIVSLPATLSKQWRRQAADRFREADELRAQADALDLEGLELQNRAYELEPW